MDTNVITALMPSFAAGFAVQRLLEILDPLVTKVAGVDRKRIYLGLLSLLAGLGFAYGAGLRVLTHLGADTTGSFFRYLDLLVTGLIISAGTEGFNSILKFLSYKKEEGKALAVAEKLSVSQALARTGNQMTLEKAMNEHLTPEFTPGAAMNIAYKSVTATTGSAEPVEPLAKLAQYNVKDPDLPAITDTILNDGEIGLPPYQRKMDGNALKDMTPGWTLQKLADIIYDESEAL
jgi:hypothetical protein